MKATQRIALPPHGVDGEFDHAAVDPVSDRLYVAHPSNDAVEVVDLASRRHLRTLGGLGGVAGVWVDAPSRLLFTSNRRDDTASVFGIDGSTEVERHRVATGVRPNGMAFDPRRSLWLVAGVGDAQRAGAPPSLTFVDAHLGVARARLPAPGRTRWALYHEATDAFYVNIADPPCVLVVPSSEHPRIDRAIPIPARGPHGLEQSPDGSRLFCACDDGSLHAIDPARGTTERLGDLSGPPDVLWVNARLRRLYVAIGEPGAVDVFDLDRGRRAARVATAYGAHTLTVDPARDEVHVFAPQTHDDRVFADARS